MNPAGLTCSPWFKHVFLAERMRPTLGKGHQRAAYMQQASVRLYCRTICTNIPLARHINESTIPFPKWLNIQYIYIEREREREIYKQYIYIYIYIWGRGLVDAPSGDAPPPMWVGVGVGEGGPACLSSFLKAVPLLRHLKDH